MSFKIIYDKLDYINTKGESAMCGLFKSVLDGDRAPVVICDLEHTIVYMNKAAIEKYGEKNLVGKSIFDCHNSQSNEAIVKVVDWFRDNKENNIIYTYRNDKENRDVYMVALRDEKSELIGYYEKHEYRNKEEAKLYDFK